MTILCNHKGGVNQLEPSALSSRCCMHALQHAGKQVQEVTVIIITTSSLANMPIGIHAYRNPG
eukprot:CAMPEP_0202908230 /NCGR_PEP_ID=MMETSP1392-20130828/45307_1 /ASSEMBLY_ACC=CAM_ASM_000868 /TAXON_ID=225041 /ORGANISM="Chlamydomonas chlamydogama, Strain SAG 11-48b" /LENGTH=62 /DNA_ID=CAMNT_0049597455 /DNA_START=491 /DNA_END=675 /DNA_ORIENTATION=+